MWFSHLYASYFLLYSLLFILLPAFFSLFMHSLMHLLPILSSPFLSLSLSKCLEELLSTDECIRFRQYPSLPLSVCVSPSRRRGALFLIKAPAPELTQRTTKSHHHHHHPWEPINNSACCPMLHHAHRYFSSVLYSRKALIHGKWSYPLKTNNKEKMANTSL